MKRFIIKLSIIVLPIIGVLVYYASVVEPNRNGDLGYLGFIPFEWDYHTYMKSLKSDSLYEERIQYLDFENVNCDSSILVIGDSFSEQGYAGFANCLAMIYPEYKVVNFMSGDDVVVKYQQFINRLLEDKSLPRIVILETIERDFTHRFSSISMQPLPDFDKEKPQTPEQVTETSASEADAPAKYNISSIVKSIEDGGNELKSILLYAQEYLKKHLGVVKNPVKHLKLRQQLFSCKGAEDDLYFYDKDLDPTDESRCGIAKQNLESLINTTSQKGIKFLIMVVPNKYELYKDFTIDDKYKAKSQLDNYTEFNDNPRFLNCKEILYPHVKNGEKDIYKCYDTHWTYFAAQYAADGIKKKLDSQR